MISVRKFVFCLDWFGYISPLFMLLITGNPFIDEHPIDWFIVALFPIFSWQIVRYLILGGTNFRPWKSNPFRNMGKN